MSDISKFQSPDGTIYDLKDNSARNQIDDLQPIGNASGNPIVIDDGADDVPVKSLKVTLEPQQDLNGYDKPWSAGGGKNILNPAIIEDGYGLDTSTGLPVVYANRCATTTPIDVSAFTNIYINFNSSVQNTKMIVAKFMNGSLVSRTANKPAGSFDVSDADQLYICWYEGVSLSDLTNLQIEEGNTATAYAPYSNICPISGWTGCKVTRTGKNLLPKGIASTHNGITYTVQENGEIVATGTATSVSFWAVQFTIPAGTYTLNGCPSGGGSSTYRLDIRDSIGVIAGTSPDTGTGANFTISESLTVYLNIRIASGYSAPSGGIKFSPMIRLASDTDADFEPYTGNTYDITFPSEAGTVYGGTVTFGQDGECSLDVDKKIISDPASGWTYVADAHVFYKTISNYADGIPVCNMYKGATSAASNLQAYNKGDKTVCVRSGTMDRVYIRDDNYTDADTFMSAIANIQIFVPIDASPIQLTPTEITTLLGYNYIASDGMVELEYCKSNASNEIYLHKSSLSSSAIVSPDEGDNQFSVAYNQNKKLSVNIPQDTYVKTVNDVDPADGDVVLAATDIPADGVTEQNAQGNPIVITDGVDTIPVKDLKVTLEPVQDLHGYDAPWPAGGGKNLLPMTVDSIKQNNNGTAYVWNDNVCTYSGCTYEILTDNVGNVTGVKVNGTNNGGGNSLFWIGKIDYIANTQLYLNAGCQTGSSDVFFRVSGFGKNVYTDANISDFQNINKSINLSASGELWGNIRVGSGQTLNNLVFKPYVFSSANPLTTFAPYSNLCPITGWTGANVSRTGKNLLNGVYTNEYVNPDGSLGTSSSARLSDFIFVGDNNFCVSAEHIDGAATNGLRCGGYDENKEFVRRILVKESAGTAVLILTRNSFSTDKNKIKYIRPNIFVSSEDINTWMTEYGTERSEYVSPGNLYPITFPSEAGTVYGGSLDVTNGTLTVDKAGVDMGSLTWTYNSGSGGYLRTDSVTDRLISDSTIGLCSIYAQSFASSISGVPDYHFAFDVSVQRIYVKDSRYTDGEAYKTAMAGQTIVYPLATPLTIQLTPQELYLIKGYNVLTASNGNMTLKYFGFQTSTLQNEINESKQKIHGVYRSFALDEDTVASREHPVGDYLIYLNRLYKATAAISSGDALVIGTNIEPTSLAKELALLNEKIDNILPATGVSF